MERGQKKEPGGNGGVCAPTDFWGKRGVTFFLDIKKSVHKEIAPLLAAKYYFALCS